MTTQEQLAWTRKALGVALKELRACGLCPIADLQRSIEAAEIRRRGCTRRRLHLEEQIERARAER